MRPPSGIGAVLLFLSCIVFACSAEERVKRDPWHPYHLEEVKDKRSNTNTRNAGDDDATPWASHEIEKKWASYNLRSKNSMIGLEKRAPRTDPLNYISRRAENVPNKRKAQSFERTLLDNASKRRLRIVKDSASAHQVNMGIGQQAAESALKIYAQLLANEQRRLQEESTSNRPDGVDYAGK